ncbi:J domain-containing protein [Desulfohalovibrio reitneri]|uniref:J domain-containing protein n=1 Tax=Desulfohalovibrio reitneri TaxID=1307759 RepID=UPI0004A6D5C0|nr:DnaJ domain-containing protein [Desulfohalovibrio reitneri]
MASPTLDESYRLLQVSPDTSLDQVKTQYRRLAFKLHPDLNPDDPQAGPKFQRLNEAYVLLTKHLEQGGGQGPRPGEDDARRRAERAKAKAGRWARSEKRTGPKPPPGAEKRRESTNARTERGTAGFEFKREEVLKDILKDPFARRVFEDIYAQVKREGKTPTPPRKLTKRSLELEWGKRTFRLDLSKGVWSGFKSWLRGQLDDDHLVSLPAASMVPGRKVRFKLQRGMSKRDQQVELTIPLDYTPGRPIRLKGLGRKLGPFRGDLYLRLRSK